ncbi:25945_t:CDS:2, partial [Racocetra persica]
KTLKDNTQSIYMSAREFVRPRSKFSFLNKILTDKQIKMSDMKVRIIYQTLKDEPCLQVMILVKKVIGFCKNIGKQLGKKLVAIDKLKNDLSFCVEKEFKQRWYTIGRSISHHWNKIKNLLKKPTSWQNTSVIIMIPYCYPSSKLKSWPIEDFSNRSRALFVQHIPET